MKLFCTLINTPLGETGCLRAIFTIYRLLKHLVFISFFVTYKTPCHAIGHYSLLILCGLRGTMPHQSSLLSSFTTFVIYRTPYHAIVHHPHFVPNPYLGRQRISLGMTSILRWQVSHFLSLLATSLINNSRLLFICVKA